MASSMGATWNIYGNSAAVERLQRAAVQGPRHAYIVSGPEFIGKTLLAQTFAAALVCPTPVEPGVPCGDCAPCRRVARGVHPDVSTFDLAYQAAKEDTKSKNLTLNISTVRDIGRHVSLRPVEAPWRMVVVDDVETMQEPAQEAFLKTLEEPPGYAVLLLLSTDAELLLPTIRSRCAIVPMVPASDARVQEALLQQGADKERAAEISVAVRGRVGLGVRALQDPAVYDTLTEAVTNACRWVAGDEYDRMAEAFRLADQFTGARDHVFDQLVAVEAAWRELVLRATNAPSTSDHPVTASARVEKLEGGVRALVSLDRCLRDLEANVRPRSALAAMVQQWPDVSLVER